MWHRVFLKFSIGFPMAWDMLRISRWYISLDINDIKELIKRVWLMIIHAMIANDNQGWFMLILIRYYNSYKFILIPYLVSWNRDDNWQVPKGPSGPECQAPPEFYTEPCQDLLTGAATEICATFCFKDGCLYIYIYVYRCPTSTNSFPEARSLNRFLTQELFCRQRWRAKETNWCRQQLTPRQVVPASASDCGGMERISERMHGIERINVLLPEVAWHFDQIILFNMIHHIML